MKAFRSTFEENHLFDLRCSEDIFTWSNKHVDDSYTRRGWIELGLIYLRKL